MPATGIIGGHRSPSAPASGMACDSATTGRPGRQPGAAEAGRDDQGICHASASSLFTAATPGVGVEGLDAQHHKVTRAGLGRVIGGRNMDLEVIFGAAHYAR